MAKLHEVEIHRLRPTQITVGMIEVHDKRDKLLSLKKSEQHEFLEAHARDRVIVAVPIAFVSEHLETLYDLDILAKEAAEKGGARGFLRVPALATRPDFVAAMADVVRKGAAAQLSAA